MSEYIAHSLFLILIWTRKIAKWTSNAKNKETKTSLGLKMICNPIFILFILTASPKFELEICI